MLFPPIGLSQNATSRLLSCVSGGQYLVPTKAVIMDHLSIIFITIIYPDEYTFSKYALHRMAFRMEETDQYD